MSESPGDERASEQIEQDAPLAIDAADRPPSLVAPATTIAFLAFLIVDALAGGTAADIVFLGIVAVSVLLLPPIAVAISRATRIKERDARLTAMLVAELAELRARDKRDA